MKSYTGKYKRGFTLIELLVVIAIIGMLSAIVLVNLNGARTRGAIARAQSDLKQLHTSLTIYESNTGLWPDGKIANRDECGQNTNELCPDGCPSLLSDYLDDVQNDPWDNEYFFDTDYYLGGGGGECVVVLGSYGPNGVGNNEYDNDDVIYIIPTR